MVVSVKHDFPQVSDFLHGMTMAEISRDIMPEKACSSGKDYYSASEASRYSECGQIQEIQRELTSECLKLIGDFVDLSKHPFLVNVGSGSGLCGTLLSEMHIEWIGSDISRDMLERANVCDEHIEIDCFEHLPFRNEVFDGAISVSAIQWVCVSAEPEKQSGVFMKEMFRILKSGTVFVAQCYPNTQSHADLLQRAAVTAGFLGGLYTSFPHQSKSKKKYMCLYKPSKTVLKTSVRDGASCYLSWPFQIDCIMSWLVLTREVLKERESLHMNPIESRIENEHFEYSCRMVRLLRRAAGTCFSNTESFLSTCEVVSCSSVDVSPCGGVFSCHVWTEGGTDEAKDIVRTLFNSLYDGNLSVHHQQTCPMSSRSTPAESWRHVTQSPMNPYFHMEIILQGDLYTVGILRSPKVPPVTVIMFEFHDGDDHGKLYTFIQMYSCTVVGADVRSVNGKYSAALLLYTPNLEQQDLNIFHTI